MKLCSCGKATHARGMCRSCYDKWLKAQNPGYAERQRQNRRDWYKKDPSKLVRINKAWDAKNMPRVRERGRIRKKLHPEQVAIDNHARRVRLLSAKGRYTRVQWRLLCAYYGNACLRCGSSRRLTVDHVTPISLGGTNDIGNLQPLCRTCNAKKHTGIADYRPDAGRYARSLLWLANASPIKFYIQGNMARVYVRAGSYEITPGFSPRMAPEE